MRTHVFSGTTLLDSLRSTSLLPAMKEEAFQLIKAKKKNRERLSTPRDRRPKSRKCLKMDINNQGSKKSYL
uniref:Uncharacterized protein n=1 Tax=Rhizophora mucronata TaxID=61149 RepID=A0A2P2Q5Z8_RHIMU